MLQRKRLVSNGRDEYVLILSQGLKEIANDRPQEYVSTEFYEENVVNVLKYWKTVYLELYIFLK